MNLSSQRIMKMGCVVREPLHCLAAQPRATAIFEGEPTISPQGATMMQIWGTKASVFRDGKWSPFMPYNEAVKLQAEHTAQQIEGTLARGKTVIMTRDQTQQLDAGR